MSCFPEIAVGYIILFSFHYIEKGKNITRIIIYMADIISASPVILFSSLNMFSVKNLCNEEAPKAFNMSKNKTVENIPAKNSIICVFSPMKLPDAVATHVIQKIHTNGLKILIKNPLPI